MYSPRSAHRCSLETADGGGGWRGGGGELKVERLLPGCKEGAGVGEDGSPHRVLLHRHTGIFPDVICFYRDAQEGGIGVGGGQMDAGTTWAQIGSSRGMAEMVWADGCNKGERVNTHTSAVTLCQCIQCIISTLCTHTHTGTGLWTDRSLSLSLCSLAHSLLFLPSNIQQLGHDYRDHGSRRKREAAPWKPLPW